MAENDIYDNKAKYERFVHDLDRLLLNPLESPTPKRSRGNTRKYYCRNEANLAHYRALFRLFESKDTSYIRRNRLINTLNMVAYATTKNFRELDRDEINDIVAFMHSSYNSPKSKSDFIKDLKYIWRSLFPETDDRGRIDETITPYPVRHLSVKIDKSREKRRDDRLDYEEFEKIISYFSSDYRIQFYLILALESLGRPQEILYTRIRDLELYDDYGKLWISSHGKEGVGFLQMIDSFPYCQKWLEVHPLKHNKDSFLFVNTGRDNFGKQLTPFNINKKLRDACKDLKIDKPITCYSLKRSGVTIRRLKGESDLQIQHTARWTSTKQLKTYDLSQQEDAFKIALVKRGLLSDERFKQYEPKNKKCPFCETINGFNEVFCSRCKRLLDRKVIEEEFRKKEIDYEDMKREMASLNSKLDTFIGNDSVQRLFKVLRMLELDEEKTRQNHP